jgi:hypothetical protein
VLIDLVTNPRRTGSALAIAISLVLGVVGVNQLGEPPAAVGLVLFVASILAGIGGILVEKLVGGLLTVLALALCAGGVYLTFVQGH